MQLIICVVRHVGGSLEICMCTWRDTTTSTGASKQEEVTAFGACQNHCVTMRKGMPRETSFGLLVAEGNKTFATLVLRRERS